jgi:RNA polymerase sigma-70 factor (ECF subfamily)
MDRGRAKPDKAGSHEIREWIASARDGCGDALGRLVERCRRYLLLVANHELDDDLKAKIGPSDLVQDTMVAAQQCFGQFRGNSEEEFRSWLRQILMNRVSRTSRRYRRVVRRELSLERRLGAESGRHGGPIVLVDPAATPASAAIADENLQSLEAALRRLPEHYRRIILLRNIERRSFSEIGHTLQATAGAARKLWLRALQQLREELGAENDSG